MASLLGASLLYSLSQIPTNLVDVDVGGEDRTVGVEEGQEVMAFGGGGHGGEG